MPPLFENPANAIGLWLKRNGIEFEDIEVKHNASVISRFTVEFEADRPQGPRDASDNQRALLTLLEETDRADGGCLGGQIHDDSLRRQLELPEPDGECSHRECDKDATTYMVAVEIPITKQYCYHHSHRAAHHLFESDLEEYDDEPEETESTV